MACRNVCKLCPRLVISQNVTFASGVLTVNLPAGSYNRGEKYCIVIAQAIPDAATINAPVVITIGTGTVQYPLDPAELRPGDRLRPPDTHPVRGLREHKPHGRLLPAAGQSLLCSRQRPEQHQRNRTRSRRR